MALKPALGLRTIGGVAGSSLIIRYWEWGGDMLHFFFACIFLLAICSPVMAQGAGATSAIDPKWIQAAITIIGTIAAGRLAFDAFGRRSILVADVPTFPRYMTSRTQYRLGSLLFVVIACIFFLLLVYEHRDVAAAASIFEWMPKNILEAVKDRSASYFIIIIGMGVVYLYFLTKEAQWNVLLMMRDLIFRWISIPQLASRIVAQIHYALRVPQSGIAATIANSSEVTEPDFRKDSNTPDRIWAETCYMKWWLTQGHDTGEDATFFTEENFGFEKLLAEFREASEDVGRLKSGATGEHTRSAVTDRLKSLRNRFSRLVACYLIYRNGSRQALRAEAKQFGVDIEAPVVENPLHYWVIYAVVLTVSVIIGVYVSAITYDAFAGKGLNVAQDADRAMSWAMYSLSNYGFAIIAVLLFRWGLVYLGAEAGQSHLVTYCWTFVLAFVLGPLGLTIAVHFLAQGEIVNKPLFELYQYVLKWGLGPALVSVYISYYLDRQTCEDLPDIDHTAATFGWRLMNCLIFALMTITLLLPALLSIPARPADSVWDVSKLRFVATGTTFCMTFALALAAHFALRRRTERTGAILPARTPG